MRVGESGVEVTEPPASRLGVAVAMSLLRGASKEPFNRAGEEVGQPGWSSWKGTENSAKASVREKEAPGKPGGERRRRCEGTTGVESKWPTPGARARQM